MRVLPLMAANVVAFAAGCNRQCLHGHPGPGQQLRALQARAQGCILRRFGRPDDEE